VPQPTTLLRAPLLWKGGRIFEIRVAEKINTYLTSKTPVLHFVQVSWKSTEKSGKIVP
jgi:hypothetical protein